MTTASRPRNVANADTVIGACLLCFGMLLPLERGFPNPQLMGVMIPSAVLMIVVLWGASWLVGGVRLSEIVRDRFVVWQGLMVGVLVFAAFATPVPDASRSSLRLALQYGTTWILAYSILRGIVARRGEGALLQICCLVAIVAGSVGIIEGVVGQPVGPYLTWAENYAIQQDRELFDPLVAARSIVRAGGTLGNPVVYSALMSGLFALALRSSRGLLRTLAIILCILSCVFSVSRTAIGMLGLISLAHVLTAIGSRKGGKAIWIVTWAAAVVGAVAFVVVQIVADLGDQWAQRLGFLEGIAAIGAQEGLEARLFVVQRAAAGLLDASVGSLFFGFGAQTGAELGLSTMAGMATLDNAYMTLLYENGIIGLVAFVTAMLVAAFPAKGPDRIFYAMGILVYLASGFSFVFYFYMTSNIPCLLLVALAMNARGQAKPIPPVKDSHGPSGRLKTA